jgi:hypothetical protein
VLRPVASGAVDIAVKDDAPHSGPGSRLVIGAAIVVLVLGVVVARWMVTPFDDWVPLAEPKELPADVNPDDLPKAAEFRCSAALGDGDSAVATEQATQALEVQQLTREPCVDPRAQNRVVGSADLLVSAGLLFLLVAVHRRNAASRGREPHGAAHAAADDG